MFNFQTTYQTVYGIISIEKDMFIIKKNRANERSGRELPQKMEVSLIICTEVNRGGIPLRTCTRRKRGGIPLRTCTRRRRGGIPLRTCTRRKRKGIPLRTCTRVEFRLVLVAEEEFFQSEQQLCHGGHLLRVQTAYGSLHHLVMKAGMVLIGALSPFC